MPYETEQEEEAMNRSTLRALLCMVVAGLALGTGAVASAAEATHFPAQPIHLVVPFPPGGAVDILARLIAKQISTQTGQSVVVENKPGANGNIGTEAVVRAKPDGYTILLAANGLATNASLYHKRSFTEQKDLEPIAYLGYAPLIMVVPEASPYHSLKDVIAAAKADPAKISYASSGNGSAPHLASELLKLTTHTQMLQVAYKGGAPAIVDLEAGRVTFMFLNPLEAMPQINGHRLRPILVGSPKRFAPLPDVQTATEAGFPELEATVWWGFTAPAHTPKDVVSALNAEINKALASPEVKATFEKMGVVAEGGSVEKFDRYLDAQTTKWATVIQKTGIHAD